MATNLHGKLSLPARCVRSDLGILQVLNIKLVNINWLLTAFACHTSVLAADHAESWVIDSVELWISVLVIRHL